MKLPVLSSILLSLSGSALSVIIPGTYPANTIHQNAHEFAKRQNNAPNWKLIIYQHSQFGGRQVHAQPYQFICYNLWQNENNWVSSARIESLGGQGSCMFFDALGCDPTLSSASIMLRPGEGLRTMGTFSDKASSYFCWNS